MAGSLTVVPYYDDGRVVLHVGHVLDVLAGLEPGSVQTCITSPPYWGLRAYGTDPQVWGGDPTCSHSLEATVPGKVLTGGTGTASAKQVSNAGSQYGNAWVEQGTKEYDGKRDTRGSTDGDRYIGTRGAQPAKAAVTITLGATCTRCGAWRGELGSEPTPAQYVANIVAVFRAVRRVLREDGTLWVNLGDSYSAAGLARGQPYTRHVPQRPGLWEGTAKAKRRLGSERVLAADPSLGPKQLLGIPWRVAFALQADGWYLRSDIIWHKPNPMPESVTDRPTKAHEYLFLLSKRAEYFYDAEAVREGNTPGTLARLASGPCQATGKAPKTQALGRWAGQEDYTEANGRNRRSVWSIPTEAYPAAHFATFPRKLVEPCVLAGTSARGQCPACGAPWRRSQHATTESTYAQIKREHGITYQDMRAEATANGITPGNVGGTHRPGRRGETFVPIQRETTGWEPSCACDAGDPVPQIVCDPFAGSGTTLAVARWHQRRAVGIELNPEYARLIEQRLAQGVLL